ncbi:hypothetical protein A8B78_18400 [Jannaschia sp. EhC01]|nr:hypothetical protein A8B78_18400 [Jannaschia sp. EhC01]
MADKIKTEALSDEDLDGVVGANPVPYPDVTSDGAAAGEAKTVADNLGTSTGSSTVGTVKSTNAVGKGSSATGPSNVKVEGKHTIRIGDITSR